MKQKFWQTKAFKELEREWEFKLAQSGFSDAEKTVSGKRVLRQRASNSYRSERRVARENKQRYYELLGQFFHEEEFSDRVEELVMERRSRGVTITSISGELKEMGERCHRETIRHIIQKFEKKWNIRVK